MKQTKTVMRPENPAEPSEAVQVNQALLAETRWQAVTCRDPEEDGQFVYAVKTTGIYCSPSCPREPPSDKMWWCSTRPILRYIDQPQGVLSLPLDIRGTVFQRRVWQAMQNIPAGQTASYSEIAERIGQPKAFRAVAHACACNCVAVAIPCHRVIRADGSLSEYRWGSERKAELLRRERNNKGGQQA